MKYPTPSHNSYSPKAINPTTDIRAAIRVTLEPKVSAMKVQGLTLN